MSEHERWDAGTDRPIGMNPKTRQRMIDTEVCPTCFGHTETTFLVGGVHVHARCPACRDGLVTVTPHVN